MGEIKDFYYIKQLRYSEKIKIVFAGVYYFYFKKAVVFDVKLTPNQLSNLDFDELDRSR